MAAKEVVLNPRPFTIGLLTVVLLVVLRVAIGWHFFQEGLSHKNDPKWSSEPFLRQAKGPLADEYKSRAPGYHEFDLWIAVPLAAIEDQAKAVPNEGNPEGEKPAHKPSNSAIYGDWYAAIVKAWDARRENIANFYGFSDEQKERLKETLDRYDSNLANLLSQYEADIENYRRQVGRNEKMGTAAGAEAIPNLQARAAKRDRDPLVEPATFAKSKPSEWIANVQSLEDAFERQALALRTEEQVAKGPLDPTATSLKRVDTVITWLLIIGGGCLLVGLFTRLSAIVLALFLASVIASQPPWVAGTVPTYFQVVEFVALLVLASSHVGRWGGLDFFIHHFVTRPFCRGKADA